MKSQVPSTVVLLINIGEREHRFLTREEAARALGGSPAATWFLYEKRIDYSTVSMRGWRSIARDLEAAVHDVQKAGAGAAAAPRYVVMGRAPLPVFAYLGQLMRHMSGDIVFLNQRQGDNTWDQVGPRAELPDGGEDVFTCTLPAREGDRGVAVISIRCSEEHQHPEPEICSFVEGDGSELLGTFDIQYCRNHRRHPLRDEHLLPLLDHLHKAQVAVSRTSGQRSSLVLALAGPAWMAFWVGTALNPRVCGRIDIPNYIPTDGYLRALASPIYRAPRLPGRARLSFFAAEPADQGRLDPGRACEKIREALETGLGTNGPYDVFNEGATQVRGFSRKLQESTPDLLHIWLHGDPSGRLYLEDEQGNTTTLESRQFVDLIQRSHVLPAIIIISACYLATLADELLALGISDCIIAMNDSVRTDAAIAFAEGFYDEIAHGSWVRDAIDEGKLRADTVSADSSSLIQVKHAENTENGEYRLLPAWRRHKA